MKDRVSDLIAKLAANHRLGTVGLTGSFARGQVAPDADIDLVVTLPLERAEPFAAALADATYRMIHLHAFAALPWHHPKNVNEGIARRAVRRIFGVDIPRWVAGSA
jgi:predicted nucleotidyltransferase